MAKPKAKAKAKAKGKAKGKAKSCPKKRAVVDAVDGESPGEAGEISGDYVQQRKAYINLCTAEGYLNYYEACQAWNFSELKEQLLLNMSPSERSRRRLN